MFIFKKKSITVDVFIDHGGIFNLFPIKEARYFFPEWWKNVKSFYEEDVEGFNIKYPTIKKCEGFISLYSKGFIIPNWGDFYVSIKSDGSYTTYTETNTIRFMEHSKKQFTKEFDNFVHLKLGSPWLIQEKQGIKFHFTNPIWNNISKLQDFIIPDGIVDYKYQNSTNVNFLFYKKNKETRLYANDPLAHIIPLTEKDVKLKLHLISPEEYAKIKDQSYNFTIFNRYKTVKNIKNKCPFNGGIG